MEITPFGIVFLPLLLATLGRPGRILTLAVVAAIFDGASVINLTFGGSPFGIQPAFAVDLLFIGVILLRYLSGQSFGNEGRVLYIFWPIVLFSLLAVASAFVLPKLFAGQVYVWPQRVEKGLENVSVPLYLSSGNVTQVVYLLVDVTLGILTAAYVAVRPDFFHRILRAYMLSGLLVVFLALWQWLSRSTGLVYPHDFLISNPNWPDNTNQTFASVYRISGPFSEPSILCFYLAGVIYASFWAIMRHGADRLSVVVCVTSTLVALLSTSTTGFAVIGIGCPLVLMLTIRTPRAWLRLGLAAAIAIPVLIALAFVVWHYFPKLVEIGQQVLSDTLDKSNSVSYEVRSRQDRDSFALIFETLGLGAGWGSVRPSSWLATMVGDTGAWGPVLILWFVLRFYRLLAKTEAVGNGDSFGTARLLTASVIGMFVAAAVSKPELTFSGFWINLGTAAAAVLSARRRPAPQARGAGATVTAFGPPKRV